MTLDELRAAATLPEGAHWAWDTMAVELEVAELLYAIVRQSKPLVVVEAGTGNGYASVFIATALKENGSGTLFTYEPDPVFATAACGRLDDLPALVIEAHSADHSYGEPDLVFIDSLGDYREHDMGFWFGHVSRPLIAVHDANGYPPYRFPASGVLLSAGRGVWLGRV